MYGQLNSLLIGLIPFFDDVKLKKWVTLADNQGKATYLFLSPIGTGLLCLRANLTLETHQMIHERKEHKV